MSDHDQFRIHLSLVSHTNIGKTTLARTLLMRARSPTAPT